MTCSQHGFQYTPLIKASYTRGFLATKSLKHNIHVMEYIYEHFPTLYTSFSKHVDLFFSPKIMSKASFYKKTKNKN